MTPSTPDRAGATPVLHVRSAGAARGRRNGGRTRIGRRARATRPSTSCSPCSDDGLFAWQAGGDANLLATQQAIPALLGHTFPLMDVFAPTPGVDLCRGAYLPIALPGQNGP
ncbi:MAG: hypothetical protein R2851_11570 [Caldilineaceae bacterium]